MSKLTLSEQETIIRYDRAGIDADIYTCDPSLMRKLNKLIESNPEEIVLLRKDKTCMEVTIPKNYVSIKKPRKQKLTDEQRKAIAERLNTSRNQKAF